jgi:hypothetical protein
MENRTIQLGALCDPLAKQLGDILPADQLVQFDATADAITHLAVTGYLSESAADRARRRLLTKIQAAIAKHLAK